MCVNADSRAHLRVLRFYRPGLGPRNLYFTKEKTLNKIEILSSIFSDHNTMKLDINYKKKKKKTRKNANTWWLNNMLLNNQWITDDIEEGRKKSQETDENESTMTQSLSKVCSKNISKREIYSNTVLLKK